MKTPGHHIDNQLGYSFYLDQGLRRIDGSDLAHYFENGDPYLAKKKYAMLSYHLSKFKHRLPANRGDTLMDICQSVFHFLQKIGGGR